MTEVVDGSNGVLSSGQAMWNLNVSKPAAASITIQDGATVYTTTAPLQPGGQPFVWNGIGTDGKQRPDGNYTLTAVASATAQQNVPVSIELQGRVDSVDLTQNLPLLSVGGQTYTMDKIRHILRSKLSAPGDVEALSKTPLNDFLGECKPRRRRQP